MGAGGGTGTGGGRSTREVRSRVRPGTDAWYDLGLDSFSIGLEYEHLLNATKSVAEKLGSLDSRYYGDFCDRAHSAMDKWDKVREMDYTQGHTINLRKTLEGLPKLEDSREKRRVDKKSLAQRMMVVPYVAIPLVTTVSLAGFLGWRFYDGTESGLVAGVFGTLGALLGLGIGGGMCVGISEWTKKHFEKKKEERGALAIYDFNKDVEKFITLNI